MNRILLAGALVLALAACDDGTGPVTGDTGRLAFSHGATPELRAGRYDARGEARWDIEGRPLLGEWAFAEVDFRPDDPVVVLASRPSVLGGGRYDVVRAELPRGVRTGDRITSFVDCGFAIDGLCGSLWISAGLVSPDDTPAYACFLASGEIQVTERTPERLRGTFAGTAACTAGDRLDEDALTVTGGTFDLPLRYLGLD